MEQAPIPPQSTQPSSPQPSSKLPLIIGGIILIILIGTGAYYLGKKSNNPNIPTISPTAKACTQETKVCPDGSTVGRTGPNCEFAPCPTKTKNKTDESKSCLQNDDCTLVDYNKLESKNVTYNCCGFNGCGEIDYSQNEWTAVNKKWLEQQQRSFCTRKKSDCILPQCVVLVKDNSYSAECIQQICQKSQNSIEGKACGGFAGETGEFACPAGYKCQYPEPMYPDAQGKCVKE